MATLDHSTDSVSTCGVNFEQAAIDRTYDQVEADLLNMEPTRRQQLIKDLAVDIQDQLRQAIAKSGRTHYRLAQDIDGITADQIDRFASGERDLRLATAALVAAALGLQLAPKPTRKARKR